MKKLLHLLVGLLLLFANFAHTEHHHEDHQLHIDCSLCLLQHNQIDKPSADIFVKVFPLYLFIEKPQDPQKSYYRPVLKITHNRAPPAV